MAVSWRAVELGVTDSRVVKRVGFQATPGGSRGAGRICMQSLVITTAQRIGIKTRAKGHWDTCPIRPMVDMTRRRWMSLARPASGHRRRSSQRQVEHVCSLSPAMLWGCPQNHTVTRLDSTRALKACGGRLHPFWHGYVCTASPLFCAGSANADGSVFWRGRVEPATVV